MELYFLRHGPAEAREDWTGDDADRPLTDKGKALTEKVAERLADDGLTVDAMITSPFLRAVQTAEIAAETLKPSHRLEQDVLLQPGFDVTALQKLLEKHRHMNRVMLVGHEDDFSITIGELIGGADLALKKSGVAMVELPDGRVMQGILRWLVPPKLLAD